MTDTDSVTHRRRMQVSKNKCPDPWHIPPSCLMNHLFPAYNIQVDAMATERYSHFIHEKDVDEVERECGEQGTRITQHLELRISEVFRQRDLNPLRLRLAVLHQHETGKQPPCIEDYVPNPARKIRERHGCDSAVIDPCTHFFTKPHR